MTTVIILLLMGLVFLHLPLSPSGRIITIVVLLVIGLIGLLAAVGSIQLPPMLR